MNALFPFHDDPSLSGMLHGTGRLLGAVMNTDPGTDIGLLYRFDLKSQEISTPSGQLGNPGGIDRPAQGRAEDETWTGREEVLGEKWRAADNDHSHCYWDSDSHMTYPLIFGQDR